MIYLFYILLFVTLIHVLYLLWGGNYRLITKNVVREYNFYKNNFDLFKNEKQLFFVTAMSNSILYWNKHPQVIRYIYHLVTQEVNYEKAEIDKITELVLGVMIIEFRIDKPKIPELDIMDAVYTIEERVKKWVSKELRRPKYRKIFRTKDEIAEIIEIYDKLNEVNNT